MGIGMQKLNGSWLKRNWKKVAAVGLMAGAAFAGYESFNAFGGPISPYLDSDHDGVSNYWEASCPDHIYQTFDFTDIWAPSIKYPFYGEVCWTRHYNDELGIDGPL